MNLGRINQMKWFKHSVTMSEEDDGAYLLHNYGLEGYARWCLILELINRDKKKRTFRELPLNEWCIKLKAKPKVLFRFLEDIANKVNIKYEQKENVLKIEVPKVALLREKKVKEVEKSCPKNKDIDIEIDKNKEKKKKEKVFRKPSLSEIKNYISENKYEVNSEQFFNFYESKGWKVGNQAMKDWQAAVRTWQGKNGHTSSIKPKAREPDCQICHGDGNFSSRDFPGIWACPACLRGRTYTETGKYSKCPEELETKILSQLQEAA